ncbi:hypothetical protein L4C36_06995 [Photobacterium japonica]|uniref:hypothetical protein n=1 Tax=Photobacterium japonica TaxID=2910235 RepID=UPI003D0ABF4C
MSDKIRLFIIECVGPMDLLQDRSEAKALEKICHIIGHEVAILTAYCAEDLEKYCDYISSIDNIHVTRSKQRPLCIHLSAHGNERGVSFGRDFLNWQQLFMAMDPLFKDMEQYNGEVMISLSACGAGNQTLVNEIEQEIQRHHETHCTPTPPISPPAYIFVTQGSQGDEVIYWDDATVSWTIFYHRLSKLKSIRDEDVHLILDDIEHAADTLLRAFKWDPMTQRYIKY